jgi:hypothetical protein
MPDLPVISPTTVSSYTATTLKPDFSRILTLDYENDYPFTTFQGQVPQEKATGSKFNFFVGRRIPRTTTAAGAVTVGGSAGATVTINVATGTGQYFSIGDLIFVPSAVFDSTHTNRYIVTAISTDALTVYPNDPAKIAQAIADTATLYRFSMSIKEGSSGRAPIQTVPTQYTQNIHTFEDYGRVNRQTNESETWTMEREILRVRNEKRIEHMQNIEAGSLFSDISEDRTVAGSNQNPRYTQNGAFRLISTNAYTYSSAMSQNGLYNFMAQVHRPGFTVGNMRLVFASMGAMNEFNKLFVGALRIQPSEGTMSWGVNFTQITYLGITWKFILTQKISEIADGAALVVAPSLVSRKVLIPTEFRENVQNPKDNFLESGWISCNALKLGLEEANGLILPDTLVGL